MTHATTPTVEQSRESTLAEPFDTKEYRRAMGVFPTGVAIITTRDSSAEPAGLTCNSFVSVSLEPPLVLWSMRKASKSIEIFRETQSFAINVLAEDQDHLSQRFATTSIENKFEPPLVNMMLAITSYLLEKLNISKLSAKVVP